MSRGVCCIYSPEEERYLFHEQHPFTPLRYRATMDLLRATRLLDQEEVVPARPATWAELSLVHSPHYLEAVEAASRGLPLPDAATFGLGSEDNPIFPGMHEAAALVVGGTIVAAERVMRGQCQHALHLAGGLHHAQRARASGFCIYNDAAVAIAYLQEHYGVKVAYVDIDAHHGDGVQWLFYDDPSVLTISLHETGQYLFPGTGDVLERGRREGYGFAVNLPLEPFTDDASFLEVFAYVVPPLITAFHPEIIISQHGCDGHYQDDMSHLNLTTRAYQETAAMIHHLAHEVAGGRWVVLGGGGYQPLTVVPRIWSLLWAEISEKTIPAKIPEGWRKRWATQPVPPAVSREIPLFFEDKDGPPPSVRQAEIAEKNLLNASQVLKEALPIISTR